MGAVLVEVERCWVAFYHMWRAASMAKKEKVFCIILWPVMKNGCIMINQSIEDYGVSPTMHQHQWQSQISILQSLVGSAGCSLLWAAQTN